MSCGEEDLPLIDVSGETASNIFSLQEKLEICYTNNLEDVSIEGR